MIQTAPQKFIKTFFQVMLIFIVATAAGTTLAAFTLFYGTGTAPVSFTYWVGKFLDSIVLGSAFGFLWFFLYVIPVWILMRHFGLKVLLFSYLLVVIPSLTIEYYFGAFFCYTLLFYGCLGHQWL